MSIEGVKECESVQRASSAIMENCTDCGNSISFTSVSPDRGWLFKDNISITDTNSWYQT